MNESDADLRMKIADLRSNNFLLQAIAAVEALAVLGLAAALAVVSCARWR